PYSSSGASPNVAVAGAPATSHPIDLTPHQTADLTSINFWSKNSFTDLPPGVLHLGGIDFDVRGLVQLAGGPRRELPNAVRGIAINKKARRLHFLHACSWVVRDGKEIAAFLAHSSDHSEQQISISYGRDVRDWYPQSNESTEGANQNIVWRGLIGEKDRPFHIRLFKTTWTNPRPDVEISTLDYVSKVTGSAPFLLAITVEE